MTRTPPAWDVEGPVQAEIFVVWLNHGRLELTGPDGAAPWIIELGETEHPVEVVDRIVRDVIGTPILLHSTSWRRARGAVILSFLVAIEPSQRGSMESRPVARSELARSEATAAPSAIGSDQVLEHALRHLAWLVQDDPVVSRELADGWREALAAYVPEPFRSLGEIEMDDGPMLIGPILVRCACGWETRGNEPEVVAATQEHGRRVHNMEATRDQVLAMAVAADAGPEA
jgi:hypothetical protein